MRSMSPQQYLKHRRRNELLIWSGYFLINLIAQYGVALRDARRIDHPFAAWEPAIWEASSLVMIAALLPLLLRFDRAYPLMRPNALRHAVAHLGFTVPFSLIHVLGMVAMRKLVYLAVGERYDFGHWPAELAYEYLKDFRSYLSLLGIIYLYRLLLRRWQGQAEFIEEGAENTEPQPVVDRFLVKKLGREFLVRVDDIDWIEASGNYVNLHVAGRVYPLRGTMTQMDARLTQAGFARVHRSAIVNLDRVTHIEPFASGDGRVLINNADTVPLSRRYRQTLRDALG